MFHYFLIWPLIAGLCPYLMIYRICHGFDLRKEVTTYFPVFPIRGLGLSYAPLKFSKEKSLLWLLLLNRLRSGGGVVDNTLDYQSRGRKIDPPLLRSFG